VGVDLVSHSASTAHFIRTEYCSLPWVTTGCAKFKEVIATMVTMDSDAVTTADHHHFPVR
jgi:hypothetical protein